ncbi:phospholipase [Legionella taurinensis]|uniref:Phospholipase n=1 Tax=Legionella taurinensis TaxID=70611 RepID=A0A3A5L9J1_9GAMM|nr:phospholipase [Legionella taurinensis]MDX1838281.1 phospholipase [Legionella taurinensis]PUT39229.1 phospholipase [Legionella taurinensis]PUT40575.1 phospholipase [Legionella taurinensis]PUT43995.1 phospholipase [Legionella taurinensis]PUT46257.1 phospholipase [Legionella taurinensis]
MIKDIIAKLLLSWFIIGVTKASPLNHPSIEEHLKQHNAGFANLEHRDYGNQVLLHWEPLSPPQNNRLTLPNGLQLSYGELVMYAGDLFGDPYKPISNCKSQQQEACFLRQFNALGGLNSDNACKDPLTLVSEYSEFFARLETELQAAEAKGQKPWEFYKQHFSDLSQSLNRIGCGGTAINGYLPLGLYLKLAQVNFDHFVPDALTAYRAGHAVALRSALKAHHALSEGNLAEADKALHLAYAQNAFANHFLTDSMSSGHMRTPRRAIHNDIALPAILNLLIANLMHDEDSRYGLEVSNALGLSWRAYGDDYLSHPDAARHVEILTHIMQLSADAIYQTFRDGTLPATYEELRWLPDFDKIEQLPNHSPLFKVDNGVLLKRVSNHDPNDHHWTALWSGLITLIDFQVHKD